MEVFLRDISIVYMHALTGIKLAHLCGAEQSFHSACLFGFEFDDTIPIFIEEAIILTVYKKTGHNVATSMLTFNR